MQLQYMPERPNPRSFDSPPQAGENAWGPGSLRMTIDKKDWVFQIGCENPCDF